MSKYFPNKTTWFRLPEVVESLEELLEQTKINKKLHGVIDYNDLTTSTTPINLVGGEVFTYLTNDGQGPYTNKVYLPDGVTEVWDTTLNQFDFTQLTLGSSVIIRIDLEVTTTVTNQDVDLELDLSIGQNPYSLRISHDYYKTAGTYPLVASYVLYIGNEGTKNNPGKIKIKSNNALTVKVNGWANIINLY